MAPLHPLLLPRHNKITFAALRGVPPNRICFATTHRNAVRENNSPVRPFKFSIPFAHGVGTEFWLGTNLKVYANDKGSWVALTAEQADVARKWIHEQGTRVYLKDFFDCSISLGEQSATQRQNLGVSSRPRNTTTKIIERRPNCSVDSNPLGMP